MKKIPHKDDNVSLIETFFETHPNVERYREDALRMREINLSELSNIDLLDVLQKSKERGEAIIHDIDVGLVQSLA